ncbi:hypothetical protein AAF712_005637 [Marasmius tenuissimus]|uniref:Uncharacterized protein n=1 Tax=Marasmius tenuissimus TaxID=585030 RepID=A0ABR3A195_9AGAR
MPPAKIELSGDLHLVYDELKPRLEALIDEQLMGGRIAVTASQDTDQHFMSISFLNVPGVSSSRLTLLWIDEMAARIFIAVGNLNDFLESFRAKHGQTRLSQRTAILVYGDHEDSPEFGPRQSLDDAFTKLEVAYPCMYRKASNIRDATHCILSYMNALLKTVPLQDLEMRRRMLLQIPGVTRERANIVLTRYPTLSVMTRALIDMQPDIDAGRIVLNRNLFTGRDDERHEELWVRNVYIFFTDRTGRERLFEAV